MVNKSSTDTLWGDCFCCCYWYCCCCCCFIGVFLLLLLLLLSMSLLWPCLLLPITLYFVVVNNGLTEANGVPGNTKIPWYSRVQLVMYSLTSCSGCLTRMVMELLTSRWDHCDAHLLQLLCAGVHDCHGYDQQDWPRGKAKESNQNSNPNLTPNFLYTGCFVETDKNYLLIVQARKQLVSWGRCPFLN